jgi:addiction module RelB/DinJ family antitoxin
MIKEARINLRISKETKDAASIVAANYGFSLSGIINAFLNEVAQTENVPLNLERKAKKQQKGTSGFVKYSKVYSTLISVFSKYDASEINEVFIFGPYSKGEANDRSKVDLYLVPGIDMTQKMLAGLSDKLSAVLKLPINLVASDDIIAPEERSRIEKEKIILYKTK